MANVLTRTNLQPGKFNRNALAEYGYLPQNIMRDTGDWLMRQPLIPPSLQPRQRMGAPPINYLGTNATVADATEMGLNMLPFVGDAMALAEAKGNLERGETGRAAFNALTAVPMIGDAAAAAKIGIPSLLGAGGLVGMMSRRTSKMPVTPFKKMQGVIGGPRSGKIMSIEAKNLDDIGDIKAAYRGGHTAPVDPEYHAPLFEMNRTYPDDIYSSQAERYYGHGNHELDAESFEVINKVRGKPDAEVTIYRAVPIEASDEILPGDWVTINKKYARQHGQGLEKYKILKAKVKAKQLRTDGNSPHEFGFTGEK